MRVLITGGAGFIGSHLAEAYLERGDEVYIIDDLSTGSLYNIKELKENERFKNKLFIHIDTILNHNAMLELTGTCGIVFHLAAAVGVQYILNNPLESIKTNIQGTEKVLELCDKFKKKVLIASTWTKNIYQRQPFHIYSRVGCGFLRSDMKNQSILKIEKLLKKGVNIPNPDSVEIGSKVDTDRISGEGVVIYSGCKIFGGSTLILKNTRLGYESPVTIENCQIGTNVDLKGGFLKEAVLLDRVSIGCGSHIREGTILEEEASIAHTVGLKHTILLPFVTLGSLINFCDCFMSGGTSKKDHSEVGSSYIHFNYTPNQDKATASLIGDVPNGVMLSPC